MRLPLSQSILNKELRELGIDDISHTTIRQCAMLGSMLESQSDEPFTHLEFGVPGIPPCPYGIEAQKKALDEGKCSIYPSVQGLPELKQNAARFIKAFIDVDIDPKCIVPTVGSMQGSLTSILECSQLQPGKDTILYICPGFSAHGRQPDILGIKNVWFDIYEYRAEKLRDKLESYFKEGNIAAILYSNPNNPAWICLTEEELQIIGELATQYDVIVLEDMAYLCMDFRKDLSVPFQPPFQSTVARYTDNYVMLLSGSKIFNKLYQREYPALKEKWGIARFGDNFILNYLYVNTSGVSHSAQYALSAMFEACLDGRYNFVKELRDYGLRAHLSREIFEQNGFRLVYDKDMNQTIGDGFFYTVTYKDMDNRSLLEALLRCGVVAIPLNTTGSKQCGIRVCVSRLLNDWDFQRLDRHLKQFVKLVS